MVLLQLHEKLQMPANDWPAVTMRAIAVCLFLCDAAMRCVLLDWQCNVCGRPGVACVTCAQGDRVAMAQDAGIVHCVLLVAYWWMHYC